MPQSIWPVAFPLAFVGYKVGQEVYDRSKAKGKNQRTALYHAILAGCIAASTAGSVSYIVNNTIRKNRRT